MLLAGIRRDAEQGGDHASTPAPNTGLLSQGGTRQDQQHRAAGKRDKGKRGEGKGLCELCQTDAAG